MFSLVQAGRTRLCDSWTRREVLRVGALSALGLSLADWVRAQQAGAVSGKGKAKSVIMIFNCGGPSHTDLWDMKPDAAVEYRGEFKPIPTNVDGIQICEHMPRLARLADKYAIIRSVHHTQQSHNAGMYYSIVGRPYRVDSTLINPSRSDDPSLGTLCGWLARQFEGYRRALPPYIITPAPHCDSTVYITPGQFGGCLGSEYDPFVLNADPNARDFKVPNLEPVAGVTNERLLRRQAMLDRVDRGLDDREARVFAEMDVARRKALELVTSPEVRRAFDLSQELDSVRDRYGRHTWGQSHLLARRLIEAGAKFVTTVNGQSIVWDTHENNFPRLKDRLIPPMEQAFSALLEDLDQRGLLDETLVIWHGDFGRTPRINNTAGRDHWPQCFSVVMAGGGIRGGQVIGESDKIGAYPVTRPVTPADLNATVYTLLGYDPHAITYPSIDGRPMPLSEGEPIRELL